MKLNCSVHSLTDVYLGLCSRAGGHHQDTKVRVNIRVKDVNDNAPEFASTNEVHMCESAMPGKVRLHIGVELNVS